MGGIPLLDGNRFRLLLIPLGLRMFRDMEIFPDGETTRKMGNLKRGKLFSGERMT
jgi:hypothetical protein